MEYLKNTSNAEKCETYTDKKYRLVKKAIGTHKMLLKICNAAWHQENPTDWCRNTINTVHKKGCKLTLSNYRAIYSIPFPGKAFCKTILMRIDDNIDTHLSKQQFGFRKNRRTLDVIFIVRQIMEKQTSDRPSCISMLWTSRLI